MISANHSLIQTKITIVFHLSFILFLEKLEGKIHGKDEAIQKIEENMPRQSEALQAKDYELAKLRAELDQLKQQLKGQSTESDGADKENLEELKALREKLDIASSELDALKMEKNEIVRLKETEIEELRTQLKGIQSEEQKLAGKSLHNVNSTGTGYGLNSGSLFISYSCSLECARNMIMMFLLRKEGKMLLVGLFTAANSNCLLHSWVYKNKCHFF